MTDETDEIDQTDSGRTSWATIDRIEAIEVRPGDTLVVQFTRPISQDQAAAVNRHLKDAFPGVPTVVLDDGTTVRVVRPTDNQGAG